MIPFTYILLNLIHALWHSYLIKKNRLIQSGQKIIEYSILSLLAGLTISILSGWQVVPLILFCFLTRLAWFDIFLNKLRGLPFDYEGQISKRKSLWDWIENKIGFTVFFYRCLYLWFYAAYLTYYILNQ